MTRRSIVMLVPVVLSLVGGGLSGTARAAPAPPPVEGVITALDAASITVFTRTGTSLRVLISSDTRIVRRQAARFDQIRPHDFVGVTAKREPDGTLTAVSINIFPPEFQGRVREGQFLMESGNLMTNAMVFQNVRRIEGRTLYLRFPEGTAVINVPGDAEIFRLTTMRFGELRSGMRVVVRGTSTPDGSLAAGSLTVVDVPSR
ncbi:MAG: DUF5666 domain-containing protein [Armatimonadota bacterium]|nr:DUF5666 domain-containing protein [Armatimonadota bacterium]